MAPPLLHSTKPAKTSRYIHNVQDTSLWFEIAPSLARTVRSSAHFSQTHRSHRRITMAQASVSFGGPASSLHCGIYKLAVTGITYRHQKRSSCLPAYHHLPVPIPPTWSGQRPSGRREERQNQCPQLGTFWPLLRNRHPVVQVLLTGYDSRHSHTAASTTL